MFRVTTVVVLTLLAAAVGGVAGAVAVVLRPSPSTVPARGDGDGQPRSTPGPAVGGPATRGGHAEAAPRSAHNRRTWSARVSSADAEERHAAALELLQLGPSALAQARAVRPSTAEGRALQERLVAALRKMTLLRRGDDYEKLPPHLKLQLDLDAMASVVPAAMLAPERIRFWTSEVELAARRVDVGSGDPGAVSLARLELLAARRDAGEIAGGDYAAAATEHVAVVLSWLDRLRQQSGTPPARVAEIEERLRALR